MIGLLGKVGRDEVKWMVRIILKDLKISLRTETVLEAYHPDALEYFNLTNSLKRVADKFFDPEVQLDKELLLFNPIKPMLASKKPIPALEQYLPLLAETKYDGERLQAHFTE
jgi:DNA ligase-4